MSQPKVFTEAIGRTLKARGFVNRKADTWVRDRVETIQVVNLQKSAHARQYYLNLGIWLRCLGKSDAPDENRCHVRLRWNALASEAQERLRQLLDLDDSMPDTSRVSEIQGFIHCTVLPFFEDSSTLRGLRSLFIAEVLKDALIHRSARELFEAEA